MKVRIPGHGKTSNKNRKMIDKAICDLYRKNPILSVTNLIPSYMDDEPKEKIKPERLAVYCIQRKMWFDTKKGWQAKHTTPPSCPVCGALLMQIEYDNFIQENKQRGRLDEVMTWEYPDGKYWKGE